MEMEISHVNTHKHARTHTRKPDNIQTPSEVLICHHTVIENVTMPSHSAFIPQDPKVEGQEETEGK